MKLNPGSIFSKEAYALGKMLDHSSWNGRLPRNITPSDIDMTFDNNGDVLACELSRKHKEWKDVPLGQRLIYERFVFNGTYRHIAAICYHTVAPDFGRKIDSRDDIKVFQLLVYSQGDLFVSEMRQDWIEFIEEQFYSNKPFSDFGVKEYEKFNHQRGHSR